MADYVQGCIQNLIFRVYFLDSITLLTREDNGNSYDLLLLWTGVCFFMMAGKEGRM